LEKHEQNFNVNEVQRWRVALEEAGNIRGLPYKKEYVFNGYFGFSN